jgi:hypothetical protein
MTMMLSGVILPSGINVHFSMTILPPLPDFHAVEMVDPMPMSHLRYRTRAALPCGQRDVVADGQRESLVGVQHTSLLHVAVLAK